MKNRVRELWSDWLDNGEQEFTQTGRRRRASYDTVATWIVQAWEEIPNELIKMSFPCCGISDNSQRDELHFSLKTLLETREVPDDVATESEHDEDSDEDGHESDDGSVIVSSDSDDDVLVCSDGDGDGMDDDDSSIGDSPVDTDTEGGSELLLCSCSVYYGIACFQFIMAFFYHISSFMKSYLDIFYRFILIIVFLLRTSTSILPKN